MRQLVGIILISLISALLSVSVQVSAKAETEGLGEYWLRPFNITNPNRAKPTVLPQVLPKNCAVCHSTQYNDWSGALHSMSTGPGLMGQLDTKAHPGSAESCYFCHAPALEQYEYIEQSEYIEQGEYISQSEYIGNQGNEYTLNPGFNKPLQSSGVSCAICHMRGGNVFGPMLDKEKGDHESTGGTFTGKEFFKDSGFCKACHQLPLEDGYRLNGKLLVNTFTEWQESPYPKEGITCQACHMPNGRHLFRGIHDPDMTKKGLTITSGLSKEDGKIRGAWINIKNSNVGHYFPTYVTPLIVVQGSLRDDEGNLIDGSLKEKYLGRRISLDLTKEIADSRIAPYESFRFDYSYEGKENSASAIRLEAVVYPDDFYSKFFKALLEEGLSEDKGSIEAALSKSLSTPYTLYTKTLPIFD